MEKTSGKYFYKNFSKPDERRNFAGHGYLDVLNLGSETTIGRAVFEPGWKWSNDVKPIANTPSCQSEHVGYCISGSLTIRMDNGDEFTVKAGDSFYCSPGHDAWVEGNEPCLMLDFTGFKEYAKPKQKAA